MQLSSTGTWQVSPVRMNELIHCRHCFAAARAPAEVAVEILEVPGMTGAQWDVHQRGHAPAPDPEAEMLEAAAGD